MTSHISRYLKETIHIAEKIDQDAIERTVALLIATRNKGGRLFFVGVGGGAGHASHAVCDFRKIGGFEAYAPTDNVSELTARINDDGWDTAYANWLQGSRLGPNDIVFVFSVGGGDDEKRISVNLVQALKYAKQQQALVCGVVGRSGGYTAQVADACIVVPTISSDTVTPHTEEWQAIIWHLIVSHPELKQAEMKWESVR